MRILLDCSRISTGGAVQNGLSALYNAGGSIDHEWHAVITSELSRQLDRAFDQTVESVERLDNLPTWQRRYFVHLKMPALEERLKPDVVFSVCGPAYWRSKAPHVMSFAVPHLIYPDIANRYLGHIGRRLQFYLKRGRALASFKSADLLLVQTATVKNRVIDILGIPASKVRVVRNSFSPVFAKAASATQPRRSSDGFTILVPTAYYPHKNLEILPAVAQRLAGMGAKDFLFRVTIPPTLKEWQPIVQDAASRGVAQHLCAIGNVKHADLAQQYAQAVVVFLPTVLECSTAVYPEAFLSGVPLVTSDLDFARELCGTAALFVDPFDVDSCAEALQRVANDRSLGAALVVRGHQVLSETYPTPAQKWKEQISQLEQLAGT